MLLQPFQPYKLYKSDSTVVFILKNHADSMGDMTTLHQLYMLIITYYTYMHDTHMHI